MGVFTADEYRVFAEARGVSLDHAGAPAPPDRPRDRAADLRHPGRDRRDPRLHARPRASARSSASCSTTSPTPSTWATSPASSSPALEARHVKSRPSLGRRCASVFAFGRDPTGAGYRLKHGRLDLADPTAFLDDPVNILRLFEEGLATDIPIHPTRCGWSPANLDLIDDARARGPRGEPHLPRAAAQPQQPRAGAAADERGRACSAPSSPSSAASWR